MYRKFEHLEKKLENELMNLNEKYRAGAEMSEGDLKRADMLAHTAKCLMAYEQKMMEMENQQNYPGDSYGYMGGSSYGNSYNSSYDGNSYARDSMGRYTSRDMGPGHYPMMPNERRW